MTAIWDSTYEGTVAYNGFTFPSAHAVAIAARPEYSQDGRVAIGTRYEIRVLFYTTADTQELSGSSMLDMQTKLRAPRGVLTLSEKGLGFHTIGIGLSTSRDFAEIMWGPKPTSLRITPLGGNRTFECEWSCQFVITLCLTSQLALLEFSYSMTLAINQTGHLSRQINGLARFYVPAARNGATTFTSTLDQEYAKIDVPIDPGWRRLSGQRTILPSKDGWTFSFVDAEVEGRTLPPGIIDGTGRLRMTSIGAGTTTYNATLNCSFTEGPAEKYGTAAAAFFFTLAAWTQKLRQIINPGIEGVGQFRAAVLPTRIDFEADLYESRRSTFTAEMIVNAGSVSDIFGASKMWSPLDSPLAGHDPSGWLDSMRKYWQPGGYTGAYWDGQDALYGLCDHKEIGSPQVGNIYFPPREDITDVNAPFDCTDLEPQESWIGFENRLIYHRYDRSTTHTQTQPVYKTRKYGGSSEDVKDVYDAGYWSDQGGSAGQLTLGAKWDSAEVEQIQAPPKQEVLMVGRALRVHFLPTVPELLEVEGVPVEPVPGNNTQVELPRPVDNLLGCQVYMVQWAKRYRFKASRTPSQPIKPLPDLTR